MYPMFQVSKVKSIAESDLVPLFEPPPPTRVVDGGAYLHSPEHPGEFQFLVNWEGYGLAALL